MTYIAGLAVPPVVLAVTWPFRWLLLAVLRANTWLLFKTASSASSYCYSFKNLAEASNITASSTAQRQKMCIAAWSVSAMRHSVESEKIEKRMITRLKVAWTMLWTMRSAT